MGVKGAKSLALQGGEEVRAITEGFNLCNDYKRFKISFINSRAITEGFNLCNDYKRFKISFINREERAARG